MIILKGEGKAFCSGDDLSEGHEMDDLFVGMSALQILQDTTRLMLRMPKVIISDIVKRRA